jgi:serine/threonine protein kinase
MAGPRTIAGRLARSAMAETHLNALPQGYEFEGYRIEQELGAGGFGITYKATELLIGRSVAIKEYLPPAVALRARDSISIHPIGPRNRDAFELGLKRFRKEARALVNFRHPNIVAVHRFFEANGTAYLVMAFEEGMSLGAILKRHGRITEDEIREVLDPLLDGVALVHQSGFLHRDIKPDNIIIRRVDGSPVLIDFGAARQVAGGIDEVSMPIVSAGYSPFEQYANSTRQGPFSDIYALGATAYACVTGHRPTDATDRLAGVHMMPALEAGKERYDELLLRAIDAALVMNSEERPQSIAEWRAILAGQAPARDQAPAAAPARAAINSAGARPANAAAEKPPANRWLRVLAYAAGIAAIAVVSIVVYEAVRAWRGQG